MLVSEIFDQLTYGELGEIGLGGRETGGILPENYANIINHINMGLTELHTLFPLKSSNLLLTPVINLTKYFLDKKHALTNVGLGFTIYIDDSNKPFDNDLLKIEQVFDELNNEFILNDPLDLKSLFTPEYNVLEIPIVNMATIYNIKYRANHTKLDQYMADPSIVEISIPDNFVPALLYYIASRVLPNTPSLQGDTGEGIKFTQKFNAEIIKLKTANVINNAYVHNTRLERNGWL